MASGKGQGGMSVSMKLIRLLIILFNLAFVVLGITLLAIGIYVMKDPKMQKIGSLLNPEITATYSQSLTNIQVFAVTLIVIGSVLLLIGFLGCCGAIKGFRFLHLIYAVVISLIIIAEVTVLILFVGYQNRFRIELVSRLQHSIQNYYVGTPIGDRKTSNPISLAWDFAQLNLQCCGAVTQNDFSRSTNWTRENPYEANMANLMIPFTCCPMKVAPNWSQLPSDMSSANECAKTGNGAYDRGCYDRLMDLIVVYKKNVVIGVAIVFVVEILAVIFAISLYCRKSDYNTV